MYSLISGFNDANIKINLAAIKYLFWAFVLTIGEPDIIDAVIQLLQSWSTS